MFEPANFFFQQIFEESCRKIFQVDILGTSVVKFKLGMKLGS